MDAIFTVLYSHTILFILKVGHDFFPLSKHILSESWTAPQLFVVEAAIYHI